MERLNEKRCAAKLTKAHAESHQDSCRLPSINMSSA